MDVVKLNRKNQITLPKVVRRQLHLGAGNELFVKVENGKIVMVPKPKSYARYTLGLGKHIWQPIEAAEHVRKERAAWERKQRVV